MWIRYLLSIFLVVGLSGQADATSVCDLYKKVVDKVLARYIDALTFKTLIKQLKVPVSTAKTPAAHATIQDTPFKSFYFNGKEYQYNTLPAHVKMRDFTYDLLYGRPAKSLEDARNISNLLFQYGRSSRGTQHRDILKHAESTREEVSGFFPTSIDLRRARYFAFSATRKFGVIFVIDPKGAEVLSIRDFTRHLDSYYKFAFENEVVFSETIRPGRIKGAIIFERTSPKAGVPVEIIKNPNYMPSK